MDQNTTHLTFAINDLIENVQDTFIKIMRQNDEHLHLAINDLLEAWLEFTRRSITNPDQLAHAQLIYWQDYLLLCKDLNRRLTDNNPSDSTHELQNKEGILLSFIEKFSFLISQHIPTVIKFIFPDDEENKKVEFYTKQFTEAFAQHNFINTYKVLYANLSSGKAMLE